MSKGETPLPAGNGQMPDSVGSSPRLESYNVEHEGHRFHVPENAKVGTLVACVCHPEQPAKISCGIDGEYETYTEWPVDWSAALSDDDGEGADSRSGLNELRLYPGDVYRVRLLPAELASSRIARHPWIGTSLICTQNTAPHLLPDRSRAGSCPICSFIADDKIEQDVRERLVHRVEWRLPVLVLACVGATSRYPSSRPLLLRLTQHMFRQMHAMGGLPLDVVVEVGREGDRFGTSFIRATQEKFRTPPPRVAYPPVPAVYLWPAKALEELLSTIRKSGFQEPKRGRVERWREQLPHAQLVSCVWGTKKPQRAGYLEPTKVTEWMADPKYVERMDSTGGIALNLTPPYAAIDLDRDDDVPEFLRVNPWAANALRIIGGRGCKIIVRIAGDYPKQVLNATTRSEGGRVDHVGEFRGFSLAMLDGLHKSGRLYRHEGSEIPEIKYASIKWPLGWVLQRPREKTDHELYGGEAIEGGLLDFKKLRNVRPHPTKDGAHEAQCPACCEEGSDRSGNHLMIFADGRYGCVVCPEDTEHRSRVFALAGRDDLLKRHRKGASESPIQEALLKAIDSILNDEGEGPKGKPLSEAVITALCKQGTFYSHADQPGFRCCYWLNGDTRQLFCIAEDMFKAWLADWTTLFPGSAYWPQVTLAIAYHALRHGKPVRPEAYWASFGGTVYLSCGPGDIVRISAEGTVVVPNGTDGILFLPAQSCASWKLLPVSEALDPFLDCPLFRDASIGEDSRHGRLLVQLWVYALIASTERPPLALIGDGGSGKTPLGEGLQRLLLGTSSVLTVDRSIEKGDVMVTLDGGGIALLDNVDSSIPWFCDFLASVTTGGEQHKRQLYTDKERVRLRSRGGIVLTSASPMFAADANVSDRLVIIRMRRRESTHGKAELFNHLNKNRNAYLSHIVYILAAALADGNPIPSGLNQRFPDFAALALRVGRALKMEEDAAAALLDAEADKSRLALANDDVAQGIRSYVLRVERFLGTASQLADILGDSDPQLQRGEQLTAAIAKRLQTHWVHFARIFSVAKVKDRKDVTHYCLIAEPGREEEALQSAKQRVAGRGRGNAGREVTGGPAD